MKSVEFLIAGTKQKIDNFLQKKGGQHDSVSCLATKFSSQTTNHLKVKEIFFPKIYIVEWFRPRVIL